MAVAGCINAYDCSGCLIRTLECLQSSNIGVGVQYCAPNPLDDKRLDYIKYTDKCGCVQCLSGENEILIYATNGVIKNLTLTNDDANEKVVVKWNDLFGSNWKKTVVRYKTGGYPTSITDGTLAVEELTMNQYSSTGYSVSGLSDSTTYYFSVFAVDLDDTIIDVQTKSITTNFGWKPTANTTGYFKFDGTLKNEISGITYSASGITYGTLSNGKKYAIFPGNSNGKFNLSASDLNITGGGNELTIAVWFQVHNTDNIRNEFSANNYYTSTIFRGGNAGMYYYDNSLDIYMGNSWSEQIYNTNERHLFGQTIKAGGKIRIYFDGQLMKEKTMKSSLRGSADGSQYIGCGRNGYTNYFNGKQSELIFEKVERSEDFFLKYFNKTKSIYGL